MKGPRDLALEVLKVQLKDAEHELVSAQKLVQHKAIKFNSFKQLLKSYSVIASTSAITPNDHTQQIYQCDEFEFIVHDDKRATLPVEIYNIIKKNKSFKFNMYLYPGKPRIILCPIVNNQIYVQQAEKEISKQLKNKEDAERIYIHSVKQILIKPHRKIKFSHACSKGLNIQSALHLSIIGVGLWFEIWKKQDWDKVQADNLKDSNKKDF